MINNSDLVVGARIKTVVNGRPGLPRIGAVATVINKISPKAVELKFDTPFEIGHESTKDRRFLFTEVMVSQHATPCPKLDCVSGYELAIGDEKREDTTPRIKTTGELTVGDRIKLKVPGGKYFPPAGSMATVVNTTGPQLEIQFDEPYVGIGGRTQRFLSDSWKSGKAEIPWGFEKVEGDGGKTFGEKMKNFFRDPEKSGGENKRQEEPKGTSDPFAQFLAIRVRVTQIEKGVPK